MKKAALFTLVTLSLILMSCPDRKNMSDSAPTGSYLPGQVETAYAYIHGGYVGMAKVSTDEKGDLTVQLDEAFLPHTLAKVDLEMAEWNEENTVTYVGRSPVTVAKYVSYNGKNYVGSLVGKALLYVEADDNGNPSGGKDLEKEIIKTQDTMAAYYNLIQKGQFAVYTRFKGEPQPVTTTSYGGLTKMNSPGYWSFGLTWAGNMKAIENFAIEKGIQFSHSEMKRAAKENSDGEKLWSVADAVTGATNSDFKDYFGLIQYAAGKLKTR